MRLSQIAGAVKGFYPIEERERRVIAVRHLLKVFTYEGHGSARVCGAPAPCGCAWGPGAWGWAWLGCGGWASRGGPGWRALSANARIE